MKNSRRTFLPGLITGLLLIIFGAGGIGYIPGKSLMISLLSIVIAVTGISLVLIYFRLNRPRRRHAGTSDRRRDNFPVYKSHSYSQFAA